MILTMACRGLIDGCTPLFAISGNAPGVGKGLLLDVAHSDCIRQTENRFDRAADKRELDKALKSALLEGRRMFNIDNAKFTIEGPSIEAFLTARVITGRILVLPKRWASFGIT